jgi:hypothetical protein
MIATVYTISNQKEKSLAGDTRTTPGVRHSAWQRTRHATTGGIRQPLTWHVELDMLQPTV